jgi:hypothetical protein
MTRRTSKWRWNSHSSAVSHSPLLEELCVAAQGQMLNQGQTAAKWPALYTHAPNMRGSKRASECENSKICGNGRTSWIYERARAIHTGGLFPFRVRFRNSARRFEARWIKPWKRLIKGQIIYFQNRSPPCKIPDGQGKGGWKSGVNAGTRRGMRAEAWRVGRMV